MKSELEKYKQKIIDEVSDGKRGSTYPALKKLGLRPGTEKQTWFQLPSHTEQQLSSAQSAELIADHFCHISQEFSPLSVTQLPPNIQHYLTVVDQNEIPSIQPSFVLKKIRKAKKPRSSVPGDLPPKLVREFPIN